MLSVALGEDDTSSGGEDQALSFGKLVDDLSFAFPKTPFSLELEYRRYIHARAGLDLMVAVLEVESEDGGELAADSGFSRAHGAN